MSKIVPLRSGTGSTVSLGSGSGRRGRPGRSAREALIREALKSLDDPITLEESPLASLAAVRRLAETTFRARTCAEGLALAFALRTELTTIAADLVDTPVGALARGLSHGQTQVSVARALGITEEHLCRRWKPILITLVLRRLDSSTATGQAA